MAVIKIRDEQGQVVEIPVLAGAKGEGIPEVTAADNGKFLRVVGGKWEVSPVQTAEGADF